jgi:hypothetical protein
MSNRTLVELNHDYCPHGPTEEHDYGRALASYMRGADPAFLPPGVIRKHYRHHSDPDPMMESAGLRNEIIRLRAELAEARRVRKLDQAEIVAALGQLDSMAEQHEIELRATANDAEHARAKALEEAAVVCEAQAGGGDHSEYSWGIFQGCNQCAAAIRALAKEGGA